MTFQEICAVEPRVKSLYDSIQPDEGNWREWWRIKSVFSRFVGWGRDEGPDNLQTCEAYDTVYQACLNRFEGDA